MKKVIYITFVLFSSFVFVNACYAQTGKAANDSIDERTEDFNYFYGDKAEKHLLAHWVKPNGKKRYFYQVSNEDYDGPIRLFFLDEDVNLAMRVKTPYFRYKDDGDNSDFFEDGTTRFKYLVSPERNVIYLATTVLASRGGFDSNYQLFIIDMESGNARFIDDCAGIKVTKDGFMIAKARVTNEGHYFTFEMVCAMHDVYLDWNGKVIHDDKEHEYSENRFWRRYNSHKRNEMLHEIVGMKECE